MKKHHAAYVFSLLLIVCAISLLGSHPLKGRFQLIAGGMSMMGFLINIMIYIHLSDKR